MFHGRIQDIEVLWLGKFRLKVVLRNRGGSRGKASVIMRYVRKVLERAGEMVRQPSCILAGFSLTGRDAMCIVYGRV